MTARVSLLGRVFGRLTVHGERWERGVAFVVATCECGTTREFRAGNLRSGKTESCGCLMRDRSREAEQARNRRDNHLLTFQGETLCVTDWAARTGVGVDTLLARIKRGLEPAEVLDPNVRGRRTHATHDSEERKDPTR